MSVKKNKNCNLVLSNFLKENLCVLSEPCLRQILYQVNTLSALIA